MGVSEMSDEVTVDAEAENTSAEVESDIDFNSASAGDPNGFQLPEDPDDLLEQGWEETTHPNNKYGNREFRSPDGKLQIRYDPKSTFRGGHQAYNHYHIYNALDKTIYYNEFGEAVKHSFMKPNTYIILPELP